MVWLHVSVTLTLRNLSVIYTHKLCKMSHNISPKITLQCTFVNDLSR